MLAFASVSSSTSCRAASMRSTVSRTANIKGNIHCYFGGQDAMIPEDQVQAVREALENAGTTHRVQVYDDADHGFHCDQRDSYNETASRDAWNQTMALFNSELRA